LVKSRRQRSEVRGQRSDDGGQRAEVRGQMTEVRGQRSENRSIIILTSSCHGEKRSGFLKILRVI